MVLPFSSSVTSVRSPFAGRQCLWSTTVVFTHTTRNPDSVAVQRLLPDFIASVDSLWSKVESRWSHGFFYFLFFFPHEKGKSLLQPEASHQQHVGERESFGQDERSLLMSQQL